jgi:transcriptional regulator with XRE-family HTH domain
VQGAIIGRDERDEVKPSVEVAAAIAEALEVSLDYLVGNRICCLKKILSIKLSIFFAPLYHCSKYFCATALASAGLNGLRSASGVLPAS